MHKARLLAVTLCTALVLSGCALKIHKDFEITAEWTWYGDRDSLVVSRGVTRGLRRYEVAYGDRAAVGLIASSIRDAWWFDHVICPRARWCQTSSSYVDHHPAKVLDALVDAMDTSTCWALTFYPPYNATHKGRHNGCIYN